ncbi:MAG TPA: response regulator [Kofleriaceae bacterium]|nr:response regulator [Kofleriaceae bacterium]
MSATIDFDAEELSLLRQLFSGEANDALDTVTRLCLDGGANRPSHEAFGEMLRVTHAIKGAGGTVGLLAVVDAVHQLESNLLQLRDGRPAWNSGIRDAIVDICDGIRELVERGANAVELPVGLATMLRTLTTEQPAPVAPLETDPASAPILPLDAPRSHLRVAPERIDTVMSNAAELLFDRTRIERRTQLLRTVARDIARIRQQLRSALDDAAPHGGPAAYSPLAALEAELAGQATLLSQTSAALIDETEALRRTIGELQKSLTAMRMDTAQSLFSYSARALRALRRATGAAVELVTRGETTEFDKTVAEALHDPIVQLLRNVVSHGVDTAAARVALGKPAHVTITMTARQDAGFLVLSISDDGAGVDTKTLRERLVQTDRWTASRAAVASEDEVLRSLFVTPVSVKDDATAFAGHGIGLDSVRQSIARLGGEVSIASSVGRGTTFTLRLPLSTAVGTAMLFKVAGQVYAIPSVFVGQSLTANPADDMIAVRHEQLPVLSLEQLLGSTKPTGMRPAMEVTYAGRSVVCTVDKIVGLREIVIKQLDPLLAPLTLYAGATISGSGKVQLILDPAQLVRRGHARSATPHPVHDSQSAPMLAAGRALVVDDSRAIREAMTSMLSREGWIVDVAEDGARALQNTAQHRYDLLVTDLEMPNLDGWGLIGALRADPKRAGIAVIIITSRAHAENRRRARDLQVRALVPKPITRRKLLEALASPNLHGNER